MWVLSESRSLSAKARDVVLNPNSDVFISVISLWEIVTKRHIGRLDFNFDHSVEEMFDTLAEENGFTFLGFELRHLVALESLPLHHRDPFDRALIAQAMSDDLTLVSRDAVFSHYPVSLLW